MFQFFGPSFWTAFARVIPEHERQFLKERTELFCFATRNWRNVRVNHFTNPWQIYWSQKIRVISIAHITTQEIRPEVDQPNPQIPRVNWLEGDATSQNLFVPASHPCSGRSIIAANDHRVPWQPRKRTKTSFDETNETALHLSRWGASWPTGDRASIETHQLDEIEAVSVLLM